MLKSNEEWCEWFRKIEEDPFAIVHNVTPRLLIEAKEHINSCDTCYMRHNRVLAKAPPETFMDIMGEN